MYVCMYVYMYIYIYIYIYIYMCIHTECITECSNVRLGQAARRGGRRARRPKGDPSIVLYSIV